MKKSKKQRKQNQPQTFDRSREDVHRTRARKALEEGSVRRMREELDFLLKCNPQADIRQETMELHLLQGSQLFARNDYRTALGIFQQARALSDDPNIVFAEILRCHVALGDFDQAMTFCAQGFAMPTLSPDNAAGFLKTLLLHGRNQDAREALEGAPERFHERDRIWAEGVMMLQEGKTSDAVTIFGGLAGATAGERDRIAAWYAYALALDDHPDRSATITSTISDRELRGWLHLHHHQRTGDATLLDHVRNDHPGLFATRQARHKVVRSLQELLDSEGVHEAGHLLEKMGESAKVLRNYTAIAASIYSHAADMAIGEGMAHCAVQFWENSLRLRSEDLEHHLNVLALVWPAADATFPDWVARASKLLDSESEAHPDRWPTEQITFTRGELAALLGIYHLSHNKLLRARTEGEKGVRDAPSSLFTSLLQARLAVHDEKFGPAVEYYDAAINGGLVITSPVYDEILDAYTVAGAADKAMEFRRLHGAASDDAPEPAALVETRIYFALSTSNIRYIALVADELTIENHPLLAAVRQFLGASDPAGWKSTKKIDSRSTIEDMEKFLQSAASESQAIAWLQYLNIAMPIYRKTPAHKKVLAYLQGELARRAASSLPALAAGVNVAAVMGKRPADFSSRVQALLDRSDRPAETLVELQRFAIGFGIGDAYLKQILAWVEREPEHPGLLWAASTVTSIWIRSRKFHDHGFGIARRLQDGALLELYRLEEFLDQLNDDFHSARANDFQIEDPEITGTLLSIFEEGPSFEEIMLMIASGSAHQSDPMLMMQFMASVARDPEGARASMRRLKVPANLQKMVNDMIDDLDMEAKASIRKR